MTSTIEAISEADLHGYVDDQLDMGRRIEVEEYLSRHPDAAARVMADLRIRDSLRLEIAAAPTRPSPATLNSARRLQRTLSWRRWTGAARRSAVFASLLAAGWVAHAQFGPFLVGASEASPQHPAFVQEALDAHRTEQVRAHMRSQPSVTNYDPAEILAATRIAMPDLPRDWRVLDVQVFPTAEGHSVEMSLEAKPLGTLSLFATRLDRFAVIAPTLTGEEPDRTAYWQIGELAYALTGDASERALQRAASELSRTLY